MRLFLIAVFIAFLVQVNCEPVTEKPENSTDTIEKNVISTTTQVIETTKKDNEGKDDKQVGAINETSDIQSSALSPEVCLHSCFLHFYL